MKRLLFFAFVAFAAWYAWHHYHDLIDKRPSHEAIVENRSGRGMERIRLTVGGQTFVRETLPDDANASFPFRVSQDATFTLEWKWSNSDNEMHWSGGEVPRGPMVQKHHLTVDGDGAVIYQAENKFGQ